MVTWRQNLIETIVILAISIGIAILVPKINVVFGLVGSTCSVTLNFILPGLMCIFFFPLPLLYLLSLPSPSSSPLPPSLPPSPSLLIIFYWFFKDSKLLRRFPSKSPMSRVRGGAAMTLVAFGFAVGILGTTTTLIGLF